MVHTLADPLMFLLLGVLQKQEIPVGCEMLSILSKTHKTESSEYHIIIYRLPSVFVQNDGNLFIAYFFHSWSHT